MTEESDLIESIRETYGYGWIEEVKGSDKSRSTTRNPEAIGRAFTVGIGAIESIIETPIRYVMRKIYG